MSADPDDRRVKIDAVAALAGADTGQLKRQRQQRS